MEYKVLVTQDAEEDLDKYLWYLIYEKGNRQAAKHVLDDFEKTKNLLSKVAGSLNACENPRLRMLGYKKINFINHRYFMLYRIVGDEVIIDAIFHELQDYENKMI